MQIMIKHMMKNIASKPFRTLLLTICIASCAFSAMLCLDMSGQVEAIVRSMFTQITGSSDILLEAPAGLDEMEYDGKVPVHEALVASKSSGTIERKEGMYGYFHTHPFTIQMTDYEAAFQMKLLSERLHLTEQQAAVSRKFADYYKAKKGGMITLQAESGEEIPFEVVSVLKEKGLANGVESVFLGKEGFLKLDYDKKIRYTSGYIDVLDDQMVNQVAGGLEKENASVHITKIMDGEEIKGMVQMMTTMFLLMFAVCFFLVIFVTVSVSQRIISERMPVVGTFRSLGLSNRFTTLFLMCEAGIYGLLGGLLGCILYRVVRGILFDRLLSVESYGAAVTTTYGRIGAWLYFMVVLGAVLVECGCSLKEIIVTARMSIRDIIFDNKDTKYRLKKKAVIAGGVLFLLAVFVLLLPESIPSLFLSFAAFLVALAFLFPLLLAFGSGLLQKFFEKREKPVYRLAAMEIYARKSTVGSAVLCVTAAALAIILFIFVTCLDAAYDIRTYSSDLCVSLDSTKKASLFSYIRDLEGVTDTEMVYRRSGSVRIGGRKEEVNLFGMDENGYRMLSGLKNLPDKVEEGECYMDELLAKNAGLKSGDTVELIFDEDSFLPTKKSLRLAGYIDSYEVDSVSKSILIDKDLYIDIFHDYPGEILIRTKNGKQTKEAVMKYSGTLVTQIETREEYDSGWQRKKKGMQNLIMVVLFLGVSLTVLGMISSQLIGFEGRKRECAVLASTAMNRRKIAKMFVAESVFASGIALITALPVAFLSFIPFKRLMASVSGIFRVSYDVKAYVLFLIVLWIVFTMVSLFPVRALRKMELAAQLKYE